MPAGYRLIAKIPAPATPKFAATAALARLVAIAVARKNNRVKFIPPQWRDFLIE